MDYILQYFKNGAEQEPLLTPVTPPDSPEPTPSLVDLAPREPTPEPTIPDNTDHCGTLYFYYACKDKETHDRLQAMDRFGEELLPMLKKRNMFCTCLSYLFSSDRERQELLLSRMKFLAPSHSWLGAMQNIQDLCVADPNIEFGDPEEYKDNEELSSDVIRMRSSEKLPDTLCRSLFVATWTVSITIPPGWRNCQIDIAQITTNKGKQALYILAQQKFIALVDEAITFRKQFYTHMETPIIRNVIEVPFYEGISHLLDLLVVYTRMYYDLTNSLSSSQNKKLKQANEMLKDRTADVRVNFGYRSKHVYSNKPSSGNYLFSTPSRLSYHNAVQYY
jgi:hypothetical protein